MLYHHHTQQGCIVLVTTNIKNRIPVFRDFAYAREAVDVLYRVRSIHPFSLYGFVVMPNHVHILLRTLEKGPSLSLILRSYKVGVVVSIGKGAIWQSRFDAKEPHDSAAILRYIHDNPVKAGLSKTPEDYPWSSASGIWDVTDL